MNASPAVSDVRIRGLHDQRTVALYVLGQPFALFEGRES